MPQEPSFASAIIVALSQYHAGANNQIHCDDPIAIIDRWAKPIDSDPEFFAASDIHGSYVPWSFEVTGRVIANAVIPGRKEWMYTDHHLAFGGFCHNVRIGHYLHYEDLLSESFQERVKQWQESELVDDIYGPENPFLFSDGLWATEHGRDVIRAYSSWSEGLESRENFYRARHPEWFQDEQEDNFEDDSEAYSLEQVREDLLTLWHKVNYIQENLPSNFLLLLIFIGVIASVTIPIFM
jgi:hypothetical protein